MHLIAEVTQHLRTYRRQIPHVGPRDGAKLLGLSPQCYY